METFFIVLLSVVCCWLAWLMLAFRRGAARIERSLKDSTRQGAPEDGELRWLGPVPSVLKKLARTTHDAVSEATLGQASEALQREFLEALLNDINDAIVVLDENREIRFLNESAKRLFPSAQEFSGRAFLDVCRDHRIYDTLLLAEEIGAKISDRIDLRVQGEGRGRIKEMKIDVEAEPLRPGGPESHSGSWILLRDVTSQLETEQIRRDFVANASHELRTPLSIINGYLETMADPDVDLNSALIRRAVGTMTKHGDRLARIVDDMLTISKLESERDLLSFQAFDLRDSVEDMISHLMPLIEEKHARVEIDADPEGDWTLTGDRFYWDQIFFNLIENSLKQNREPGLQVTIRFRAEGGRIVIAIADDGVGIPAKDLPLVFKRFYRVQKHHSQNEVKGTGLGLSIVKRAVEAHHGTVTVDSRPGIQTVFTISVPQTSLAVGVKTSSKEK